MRILGLDPGTATTGFGIIEHRNGNYVLLDYGCIKTEPKYSLSERLKQINQDLSSLLKEFQPSDVAMEEIFFSKNVKTAIHVAHARGAILHQLSLQNYNIYEYNPLEVKVAVCGDGKADKKQMQKMIQMILNLEYSVASDDAADAIAIAICHANNLKSKNLSFT